MVQISMVEIKNFRSIKHLKFKPKPLCALIGENNAGKTNIISALNILLGETWPSERSFSDTDFYKGTHESIEISIWFDDYLSFKSKETGYKEVPIMAFHLTSIQGGRTEFKVESLNDVRYYGNNDIRGQVPLIYMDVHRNLEKQLTMSNWTLLGKILKHIDDDFKSESTRVNNLKTKLTEVFEMLKTERFCEFESLLQSNITDQCGGLPPNLAIEFNVYDPLNYYKSLQLLAKENGYLLQATDLGAGMQNLILLALFRVYASLKKSDAIIAIEEPEIFLHPHARRVLYNLMNELSKIGSQIFYTTHSSSFIDVANYETICIIRKNDSEGTKCYQTESVFAEKDEKKEFEILTQFDPERNEMFFAKKVLLVEGDTEKYVYPIIAQKMGFDLNKECASIVECGGKDGICLFASVLNAFKIPYIVVHDKDTDPVEEKKNAKVLSIVGRADRIVILDPKFERVATLREGENKPYQAYKNFQFRTLVQIPEILQEPIYKLVDL